ncbi:hypothetical protein GGR56DRAFT_165987 [Xylariaceae sp. FL0804]|nr:hypothetical protein GGR56DRAFT_165987 [Xylariaceae sp. FL0804]
MNARRAFPGFEDVGSLPTDSRGGVVIGVATMCMVIGTTMVSLRLYTRYFLVGKIGLDDWMAILSAACLFALGVGQCFNVRSGLGSRIYTLDLPSALVPFLRDFWLALLFYNITLFFIKMTFLFQYYRVVAQVRNLRIVYIISMIIIGGWTISQIMLISFLCVPIEGLWDPSVHAQCLDDQAEQNMNAIGNIVTDFIVLILPLPVLLRLNLRAAQKWALVGVFCLGFLTCIISILRRVEGLQFSNDLTFSAVDVTVWSIAEVTSGITCASLPTLKPLASKFIPSFKTKMQRFSEYRKSSHYRSSRAKSSGPYSTVKSNRQSDQVSISKPSDLRATVWPDERAGDVEMLPPPPPPQLSLYSHSRSASGDIQRVIGGPLNSNRPETMPPPTPPPKDGLPALPSSRVNKNITGWTTPTSLNTTIMGGGDETLTSPLSRPGTSGSQGGRPWGAVRVETDLRVESHHDPPDPRGFV